MIVSASYRAVTNIVGYGRAHLKASGQSPELIDTAFQPTFLHTLQNEFSSLIDEALILTISLDYDLSNPQDFQLARQTLLTLSENVPSEEASGFNSSGLGVQHDVKIRETAQDALEDTHNTPPESDLRSNDGLTTTTESSISQSILSPASSKTSTNDAHDTFQLGLSDLSRDEKEVQLLQIFPELKRIDITLALQKFDGDVDRAVESLLTTAHLEETGQRKKGIDGFYVDDDLAQTKKKKGKKRKGGLRVSASTNPSSANSSDESIVPDETHRREPHHP